MIASDGKRMLDEHPSRYSGARRVGGALPWFMAYDLVALCSLCGLWYYYYVLPLPGGLEGLDTASPIFWSSLYNLKMCYGLAMLPFLLFEVPMLGGALTKCCDTAYDQRGLLVSKLSWSDVLVLYERRYGEAGSDKAPQGARTKEGVLNA